MAKRLRAGAIDGCFLAGVLAVCKGVYAIYPPACLILGGLLLVAGALLASRGR